MIERAAAAALLALAMSAAAFAQSTQPGEAWFEELEGEVQRLEGEIATIDEALADPALQSSAFAVLELRLTRLDSARQNLLLRMETMRGMRHAGAQLHALPPLDAVAAEGDE